MRDLKFAYRIEFENGITGSFTEVTGIPELKKNIPNVRPNSVLPIRSDVPVRLKHDNIVLRRGLFLASNHFRIWLNLFDSGSVIPLKAVITLLDEGAKVSAKWKLFNAYPVLIATDKSGEKQIAVDLLELRYKSWKNYRHQFGIRGMTTYI